MKASLLKKAGGYLLCLILLILYLYLYDWVELRLISQYTAREIGTLSAAVRSRLLPQFLLYRLFQASFGGLLALPHLYAQFQKQGRWRFCWLPFVLIGLPAMLVSWGLLYDALQLQVVTLPSARLYLFYARLSYDFTRHFCGILFGFLGVGCWVKQSK